MLTMWYIPYSHLMNCAKRDCVYATRLSLKGLYYGLVTEDRFDEVTRYFVPPSDQQKLHVISYEADVPLSKG